MPKSKITKLEMTGTSFQNKVNGGTMYPYNIEFEDGTKGTANTTKQEGPPYKTGDIVEFEISLDAKGNNKISKIVKIVEEQKKFKSYYDDPIVQKRISVDTSLELANKFFLQLQLGGKELKRGQLFSLSTKIFEWFYIENPDNQLLLDRRQALKRALEMNELECEHVTKLEELIDKANVILAYNNTFFSGTDTKSA